MRGDISWDEYNAGQQGREPRVSLTRALDATGRPGAGRAAIDLGCGEGIEVSALLADGWVVHAFDGEKAALNRLAERTGSDERPRLHIHPRDYADIENLPPADLLHSSYALPYCPPEHFERVWTAVRAALRPGAVVACQMFGPHDSSFGDPQMTFHTADEARARVDGLEILRWEEEDADGDSYSGPTHWHVFHIVARRPAEG